MNRLDTLLLMRAESSVIMHSLTWFHINLCHAVKEEDSILFSHYNAVIRAMAVVQDSVEHMIAQEKKR